MTIKTLNKKPVFSNRWITVYEKTIQFGDASPDSYYVVGERQRIAAVLAIDDEDNVLLTRQYRWAVDEYLEDIPGGGVGPDEDFIDAARRELAEETGYTAKTIKPLTSRYLDSGQKDATQQIYIATNLQSGSQQLDPTESISIIKRPFAEVYQGVISGQYKESTLMLAILLEGQRRARQSR